MCRNITVLRGLDPPVTDDEIRDAAIQFVRKVGGVRSKTLEAGAPFELAVSRIAAAVDDLLAQLPAMRRPPDKVPPGRRRAVPTGEVPSRA